MEPTSTRSSWLTRVIDYFRTSGMRPQPCARPGCTTPAAFEGLCPEHHDVARQILGDDACAKGTCLSPRYRESRLCRDHFEEEAFGKVTTRWTERSQVRRAAPATHLSPGPCLGDLIRDLHRPDREG